MERVESHTGFFGSARFIKPREDLDFVSDLKILLPERRVEVLEPPAGVEPATY